MANKRVLISGYIGFSNFGDDLMFEALVNHLKSIGCKVSALCTSCRNIAKTYGIKTYHYKNPSDILCAINSSDILISGGGNLIQNETSNFSLFYYLFIILLAKFAGKKIIIFSQGIGPVSGAFQTWLSKYILGLVDIITVRDSYSQRLLSRWGINSFYSYDAAWDIPVIPPAPEKAIGIQVRKYNKLHPAFYANVAKYVDMFFQDFEIRIFSMQNDYDLSECYKLEKIIKSRNMILKTKVVPYQNPKKTIEEFSKLKFLISMRLHANILGLKFGIKTLPVSYSSKVKNLAHEFDIDFVDPAKDVNLHPILTALTSEEQFNLKIDNAKKRKFEWTYIDNFIEKQGAKP